MISIVLKTNHLEIFMERKTMHLITIVMMIEKIRLKQTFILETAPVTKALIMIQEAQ